MASLPIKSFRYGLDVRRLSLESQPGMLSTLENLFVNQGGELEKRKAFALFAMLPTGCFGLEATSAGLVTFGSIAAPTMPVGVTYQQLVHPMTTLHSVAYSMTAVKFSTTFAGEAFVAATFDDGNTFLFYGGALVDSSWAGRVYADETSAYLELDLAALLQYLVDNGWQVATTGQGVVTIKTPEGVTTSINTDATSAALGFMGSQLVASDGAATPATGAAALFTITACSVGGYIEVRASKTPGGQTIQLGEATAANTTPSDLAAALYASVNGRTWASGYTATASGAVVVIYAPSEFGDFTENLIVSATNVTIDGSGSEPPSLSVVLNGTTWASVPRGSNGTIQTPLWLGVSGSYTAPLEYKWELVSTSADGIVCPAVLDPAAYADKASATFSKYLTVGESAEARYKVTVKDAGALVSTPIEFLIHLENENLN